MKRMSPARMIDITGNFYAVYDDDDLEPVLIGLEGQPFLALFSTEEKLHDSFMSGKRVQYKVMQIIHAENFVRRLPPSLRIARDPTVVMEDGKEHTLFTEIVHSGPFTDFN